MGGWRRILVRDVEAGAAALGPLAVVLPWPVSVSDDFFHEMPEQTAETIDEDGWLYTGDLAAMDDRGYCTIEGRLKDMIIRGGENIYPKELEEMLLAHPAVAEVAVVGLPDDKYGEVVGAFVRPVAGAAIDEAEMFAYAGSTSRRTRHPSTG